MTDPRDPKVVPGGQIARTTSAADVVVEAAAEVLSAAVSPAVVQALAPGDCPPLTLRERIRALASPDNRPGPLALAAALGIFVGCSPFYGLHTVLVLVLAAAFRLNPLAALLGSQVSFPPLGLAIVGAEVSIGEWCRYRRWALPMPASHGMELVHWLWHHALLSWALGSLAVGSGLALVGGGIAWGILCTLRHLRRAA